MNISQNKLLFALLFALWLPLTACALSGDAIDGQVLEEGTHKPIPNTIIVVRWEGDLFAFVESKHVCVHVESATTDTQGHFHVPHWSKASTIGWVQDLEPKITTYHSGYTFGTTSSEKETVWLRVFTGTREERFKYLTTGSGIPCGRKDGSDKNLLPFYKARYKEIQSLAVSEKEIEIADGFLAGVEALELGNEIADQRREQRRLERLKEKR